MSGEDYSFADSENANSERDQVRAQYEAEVARLKAELAESRDEVANKQLRRDYWHGKWEEASERCAKLETALRACANIFSSYEDRASLSPSGSVKVFAPEMARHRIESLNSL